MKCANIIRNITIAAIVATGTNYNTSLASQDNKLKVFNKKLDQFAGEKVTVIYRGINYPIKTKQKQDITVESLQQTETLYAQEAYRLSGYNTGDYVDITSIDSQAKKIANTVNALKRTGQYHSFQQAYSNNYDNFFKQWLPNNKYPFETNPLLSFSLDFRHTALYACGLKAYHKNVTCPNYDRNGVPKNPELGKISMVVLDEAAIEELQPYNVQLAHNQGFVKIYSHYSNNILAEKEVSIAGSVPEEYVCGEMIVTAPNFNIDYSKDIHEKCYALSKNRFNNRKGCLYDVSKKEKTTDKILREMIFSNRKDVGGIYKNSLEIRIPAQINRKLAKIDSLNVVDLINNDFD